MTGTGLPRPVGTPVTIPVGYPDECECEVLLADGSVAGVRPIRPSDADALRAFHDRLSPDTVHLRFLGAHPHLRAAEAARFTHLDYRDRLALVAEVDGQLVAVGRYDRLAEQDRAELALVVTDAMQGVGLGSLLLEHLAAAARRRGVATFLAETLASNYAVRQVYDDLGLERTLSGSGGVADVSLPIAPTQRYLQALTDRELSAAHAYVRARLGPEVGSGSGSGSGGGLALVCSSRTAATELAAACQAVDVPVGALLVTDEVGLDVGTAIAALAADPAVGAVAAHIGAVALPARFVALGRAAGRRKPVVALTSDPAVAALCAQAGVAHLAEPAALAVHAGQLLARQLTGTWRPPDTGSLVDLPGCDPAGGSKALANTRSIPHHRNHRPRRLASGPAQQLLACYGIAPGPAPPGEAGPIGMLVVGSPGVTGDATGRGPTARVQLARPGGPPPPTRQLPLTDLDAHHLVSALGTDSSGAAAAVELVLRVARLVDDQSEVHQVQVPLGADGRAVPGTAIWTGPARGTADDPFLRRLPDITPAVRTRTQAQSW